MIKSILLCGALALTGFAQENPLSMSFKQAFGQTKTVITRSAEKMPEENYSFKPSPDVRTFGEVVGHIADAQYLFCSPIVGDNAKAPGAEKLTSKTAILEALKAAFAYCDKAYDALTDKSAVESAQFFGRPNTKGGMLSINNMHNYEHYGNMATYMRIKGLVPASSEPRPAATPKKSN